MPDDAKEWPSFSDELTRKTTDVLSRWTSAYDAGRISKREFYITLSALYDSTSGLIGRDIGELIALLMKDLKAPA